MSPGVFLTAEWRDLVLINFEVHPSLLAPFIPPGTELDCFEGRAFLSLVGFRFLETRVFGLRVPFHTNFLEINLRTYVRRMHLGELRRGVVFIREIVPRRAIAFMARAFYNENYIALPMSHTFSEWDGGNRTIAYGWRGFAHDGEMSLTIDGPAELPRAGSHGQFIIDHFWGYTTQRDGTSMEYRVEHAPWPLSPGRNLSFNGNPDLVYGPELGAVLRGAPVSGFFTAGSAVTVMRGQRI